MFNFSALVDLIVAFIGDVWALVFSGLGGS